MNIDDTQLLDCGHIAQPAGICQYSYIGADGDTGTGEGCAATVCAECIAVCARCNAVLCDVHNTRIDGQAFCPRHATGQTIKKLLTALRNR